MRQYILTVGLILLTAVPALAAFQATYNFTGQPGTQASTPATSVTGNVTAGNILRGAGLTANDGVNSMNSRGWSTGVIDLTDYYAVSLSANAGFLLNLGTLKFGDQRSGTGPTNFAIRTSLDGFATNEFAYSEAGTSNNRSFTFDSSFSNLSSVEIRIYGFTAGAAGGTYRLNNGTGSGLVLSGEEVNPVPVPPSALLVFAGVPMLLFARRFGRQR